jgi:hypothetical protein
MKLLIHGRDASRGNTVIADIKRAGGAAPVFYQADLSSLAEVRKLGERSQFPEAEMLQRFGGGQVAQEAEMSLR